MSGHARERALWLAAAILAVAAAAAAALPPPLAAFALAVTWGVTPGAWLARRLAANQESDVRAALALTSSPFVCGATLALARMAGLQAMLAAQAISVVLALLAAGEAFRPPGGAGGRADTRRTWRFALAFGVLVLVAHALQPALSWRSDGSFHAGVVWAVERGLPPEDPFNAGLPLRYAWGTHAWAAGWLVLAPRLGPLTPFVWSGACAAAAALLAVGALARRLGGSAGAETLAQALLLVGAAPFGWLILAARASTGDVRGLAELDRLLGHGVDPAFRALDPGWLQPSLVLPLDKFVVLTPFAWPLAGAAVAWLAVAGWLDTRARRALAWLALTIAAVIFAHPFTGAALAVMGIAGTAAMWRGGMARPAIAGLVVALVAGVLVTVPYLVVLAGPGGDTVRLGTTASGIFSVVIGGAIVLPLAFRALLASPKHDGFPRFCLGALALLVVAACVVSVRGQNQAKYLSVAFLLASAPAAVGAMRLPAASRRGAAVLLALAVGPTVVASVWAYAHANAASYDVPSRPPAEILTAVRRWVPRSAILVDLTYDRERWCAPSLPGETGRALLASEDRWGNAPAEIRLRETIQDGIARGRWPTGGMADTLGAVGRQVWLLVPDQLERVPDARERVQARAGGVSLVRLAPR
ncbi:MAG TPA: hypothetical protein VFX50_11715 [Gemmatimonadales bacterium]|nr:hypothetical protein [Gemmatimonadales bacterium]